MRIPAGKRAVVCVFNIIFPPVAVGLLSGFDSPDTFLNCILFLLAIIPSHIHGFYISMVYFTRKRRARRGEYPGGDKTFIHSERVITGGIGYKEARKLKRERNGKADDGELSRKSSRTSSKSSRRASRHSRPASIHGSRPSSLHRPNSRPVSIRTQPVSPYNPNVQPVSGYNPNIRPVSGYEPKIQPIPGSYIRPVSGYSPNVQPGHSPTARPISLHGQGHSPTSPAVRVY